MRTLLLSIALLVCFISSAQQLNDVGIPLNERVPNWTTDQLVTFSGTFVVGGVVSNLVEDATESRFLGILAGAVAGAGIGYVKDRVWDIRYNKSIPNLHPNYNDTKWGFVGGAVGGGIQIRIPLFRGRGRGYSKAGFGLRFRTRRRW